MKIFNIHERAYQVHSEAVGALVDGLSGPSDELWPRDRWPAMVFDGPLGDGVKGGHGPIRYAVSEYVPGRRVAFRFAESGLVAGLDGRHYFEVVPRNAHVVLRHVVDAECDGKTWIKWMFIVGPLHDALLEDALDGAEQRLHGRVKEPARWSLWVTFLRRMLAAKRKRDD